MLFKWLVLALATLSALALAACEPVQQGREGNLYFAYAAPDDAAVGGTTLNPVAVGGRIDLEVRTREGEVLVAETAESSAPDILRVVEIRDGAVVLEGVAQGSATVDVTADGTSDSIDLSVAEVASVAMTEPPTDQVLVGGTLGLHYRLTSNGIDTIVAYDWLELTATPSSAATISATMALTRMDVTTQETGSFEIASQLGDTLALEGVEPARATDLEIRALSDTIDVDNKGLFDVIVTLDGGSRAVGLHGLATVSSNEDVCAIERDITWPASLDYFAVTPAAVGTCSITVTLNGVDATTEIEVEPAS